MSKKNIEQESEAEGTVKTEKKEIVNILQKRLVRIEPISKPNEWKNLIGEALPKPFRLDGTTLDLDLPISGKTGQLIKIFDDIKKVYTPQFPNEAMTELEFMSRLIGHDLSFTKVEGNFWHGYQHPTSNHLNTRKYVVRIPTEGLNLDLTNPHDYLAYKVLEANTKSGWIAPSWNDRFDLPSYLFAIVDEKISTDRKKEQIELEMRAMKEFDKIQASDELLREFLIVKDPNNTVSRSATKDFLFSQVYDLLKSNPKLFLEISSDPYKTEKLLIYGAVKAGALVKPSKGRFETPGGENLGSMGDVIHLLNDPEKLQFRKNLEYQVENTKF